MTNIYQNLQYAEWIPSFPNWNGAPSGAYRDWKDVPTGTESFGARTKFRLKPVTAYRVVAGGAQSQFAEKNAAMSAVAAAVSVGQTVTVNTFVEPYKTAPLALLLEWREKRTADQDSWKTVSDPTKVFSEKFSIEFRIRPDYYHQVNVRTSHNTYSTQDFHDKDTLVTYVTRLITMEDASFDVKRVPYAN